MHTSAPSSRVRATARWATLAGSLPRQAGDNFGAQPAGPDGQLFDRRRPERICGPSTTFLPSAWNMAVNLAIDVVLPQPFTPATIMTVGPPAAKRIGSGGWAKSD